MTRNHSLDEILDVALCMAKKVLVLQQDPTKKCYELDDIAEHAKQITYELEDKYVHNELRKS